MNEVSDSDLIALGALLMAILSALYARHARDEARKANELTRLGQQRPLRLAVFQTMIAFARYCATYTTMRNLGMVKGTNDLTTEIDKFKWEIEQHGPLHMPDVEEKAAEFVRNAWKMQRLLDRLSASQNQSEEPEFSDGQQNLDSLVDRFAEERNDLKILFKKHLSEA